MIWYQLLIRLLAPLMVFLIAYESVKKKGGKRFFFQRLGFGYPKLNPASIWIHCASVGEVKAAEPLVRALMNRYPLIITTNTPTGSAMTESLFGTAVTHCYCPVDWNYAIRRFHRRIQPSRLWVMETELWPNLYKITHQNKVPIFLLNGRLSRKTLNSPKWLLHTYEQTLGYVDCILARSEQEREHFLKLKAAESTIRVLGNLKYASGLPTERPPKPLDREYVLLASSHKGEEYAIFQLWLTLARHELFVIVPRHPKRLAEILKTLEAHRSVIAVKSLNEPITASTKLYIDDRFGVLMPLFAHAKLVIMGGSFVAKGGHNLLEPASVKAPIITGGDMSDFELETVLLKEANGVVQCHNYRELKTEMTRLLKDEHARRQLGESAQSAVQSQTHLLDDYLNALFPDKNAQQY